MAELREIRFLLASRSSFCAQSFVSRSPENFTVPGSRGR